MSNMDAEEAFHIIMDVSRGLARMGFRPGNTPKKRFCCEVELLDEIVSSGKLNEVRRWIKLTCRESKS